MLKQHKTAPLPAPDAAGRLSIEGTSPKGLKIRVGICQRG